MTVSILILLCIVMYTNGDDFLDKFHQNKYKLKDVRAEVGSYDKDKINQLTVITFKYNRTVAAMNVSLNFKIDVEDKLELVVQFYKLASNRYITFPIRFQLNGRKLVKANIGGLQSVFKCGNIKEIYFLKNVTYHSCNNVLDATQLPPLIPNGQYRIEVEGLYLKNNIFQIILYLQIYIPEEYPDSKKN